MNYGDMKKQLGNIIGRLSLIPKIQMPIMEKVGL